jgi:3-hydroxyisobutyrate dehydrogenase-like beta-hydroxyacid dehydrogenase
MRIGFVGLGSMGGNQARLLAEASFDLMVYDVFPAALQAFAGTAKLRKWDAQCSATSAPYLGSRA